MENFQADNRLDNGYCRKRHSNITEASWSKGTNVQYLKKITATRYSQQSKKVVGRHTIIPSIRH